MPSIDRLSFKSEIDRLFSAFGRPPAKTESLSAWYAEFPSRIGVNQLRSAVSSIIRDTDMCPQNIVRAIVQACPASHPVDDGVHMDITPAECAMNRNRVERLKGIMGDRANPVRSKILKIANSEHAERAPEIAGRYICEMLDESIAKTHPDGAEEIPF